MQRTHGTRAEPHPINLHLEFLRRTLASTAVFTVKDVKLGSRISNLHVTLSQKQPNGQWVDAVEGYVTMSDLASESGLTLPTEYKLHPPAVPADLDMLTRTGGDENYSLLRHELLPTLGRAHNHLKMHLLRPEKKAGRPKSVVDQWVRFYPNQQDGKWTNDALGFVVDIFPQIVNRYVTPHFEEPGDRNADVGHEVIARDAQVKYWYPTLSLSLDVKKLLPPEGVEWLYVRVHAKAILNGRFDLNVEVFDADGGLVALSNHATLVMDVSRNLIRSKSKM